MTSKTLRYSFQALLVILLAIFSYLMLELSLPYRVIRNDIDFLNTKQNVYHITYWRYAFYIHVFTSIFTLLAGFTQFSYYILRRYKKLHRVLGYLYVLVVVIISGPAAFVMGWHANGGLPARTSFTLLAFLWVVFTFLAWYYAVKQKFQIHRAFMIRSYALTLSAIALRLYTVLLSNLDLHTRPVDLYITTAWLSWVPNLIIAEMIINMKKVPKDLVEMKIDK